MKKAFLIAILFSITTAAFAFRGEADLAYFQQFLFQKEQIGDPDFPEYQYRYVMTKWDDKIPMQDGRHLNATASLYLYEDGTYLMVYKEFYFDKPDATNFMPGPCKKITGKWSVPDKQLVLEGIGHADRAFIDGKHAMNLTYDRDIVTKGLAGHTVSAAYGYSNTDQVFCF